MLQQQNDRIAILQRSQSCLSRAACPYALRNRVRSDMQQLFKTNGIPFPQGPPAGLSPAAARRSRSEAMNGPAPAE